MYSKNMIRKMTKGDLGREAKTFFPRLPFPSSASERERFAASVGVTLEPISAPALVVAILAAVVVEIGAKLKSANSSQAISHVGYTV